MDGGDVVGGRGAGISVEHLVIVVRTGNGKGVRDQREDGVSGCCRGEDEGGAGVDHRLSWRVWPGGVAVHVYGVEGDLPVGGFCDGDLGEAAGVS